MDLTIENVIQDHYGPRTAVNYDKVAKSLFWAYNESLLNLAVDLVWTDNQIQKQREFRILDLGCGTGNLTQVVVDQIIKVQRINGTTSRFCIDLFDSSEPMLSVALQKLRNNDDTSVNAKVGSLQEWVATGTYDLIISSYAVHHLNNFEKNDLFGKIYRALRPGGKFGLADRMWANNFEIAASDTQPNKTTPLETEELEFSRVAASRFYDDKPIANRSDNLDELAKTIRMSFAEDGDQPSSVAEHIEWLRSSGFKSIKNPFHSFSVAVITAIR